MLVDQYVFHNIKSKRLPEIIVNAFHSSSVILSMFTRVVRFRHFRSDCPDENKVAATRPLIFEGWPACQILGRKRSKTGRSPKGSWQMNVMTEQHGGQAIVILYVFRKIAKVLCRMLWVKSTGSLHDILPKTIGKFK